MCSCKPLKLSLLVPLVIIGFFAMKNLPELRRYLRIASM
jgi:hypothetical protein